MKRASRSEPTGKQDFSALLAGFPRSGESGDGLIYDGRDISVLYRPIVGASTLVVTFTGRGANPVDGGFGEAFLLKRGYPAVHFLSKASHWWQTIEMNEAIHVLKSSGILSGYSRIVTYGSSMGGYGALAYSADLNADKVIALSPQYSLDRDIVPFESRWRSAARSIAFSQETMINGLTNTGNIYVVYDPFFSLDAGHVRLIEGHRGIVPIKVCFSEHSSGRVLEECKILQDIILKIIEDKYDEVSYMFNYKRERVTSALFWYGVSMTLERRGRAGWVYAPAMLAANILKASPRTRKLPIQIEIINRAITLAIRNHDFINARSWYLYLEELGPAASKHIMTRISRIRIAVACNDSDAFSLAESCHKRYPNDLEVALLYAEALTLNMRMSEALHVVEAAWHRKRTSPEAGGAYARLLKTAGEPRLIEHVEAALRRYPGSSALRLILADFRMSEKMMGSARRLIAPLLSGSPHRGPERELIARMARALGLTVGVTGFERRSRAVETLISRAAAISVRIEREGIGAISHTKSLRDLG